MGTFKIDLEGSKIYQVEENTSIIDFINKENISHDYTILARFNNRVRELSFPIKEDGKLHLISANEYLGHRCYDKTLQFVLIKAIYDIYPEAKVVMEHSLGKGIFGEVKKETPLNEKDIEKIKIRMKELIKADLPINRLKVTKEEALKIFKKYKFEDKERLIKYINKEELTLYELDGRYDYYFGNLAISTGILKSFDLHFYKPGFILNLPEEKDISKVAEFVDQKKLYNIFYETEKWLDIMKCPDVGSLNEAMEEGKILDLILISEALHEKKIAQIADDIRLKKDIKVVLIAGPTSSGKTTFSKRLGIQLAVNGYTPIQISLDDYFVNREDTPLDHKGNPDFESIYSLDLKSFNKDLRDLIAGKTVETPKFNFIEGKRFYDGSTLKIPENGILIIEGIHGLNEILTESIEHKYKYKIYISALTQLNLDDHNRISTTDVRLLRRIVRDVLSRGVNAKRTLNMWPSVRRGETKNIFVYQEEADAMFNSNIIYELCILKKHALKALNEVSKDDFEYDEAIRLIHFLEAIKEVDYDLIPTNSIMREFIGGSCFHNY